MVKNFIKGCRIFLGIVSFLFGIIGLVIPVIQGWFFLIAGIFLVHPESAKKIKNKVKIWIENRKKKRQMFEEEFE